MENIGIVIKSTGSWYRVLFNNNIIDCRIKGNFRVKGSVTTNPVAVGDKVDFILNKGEKTGLITKIHDRKNYIIRKSINLSRQAHIIAANVDLAALLVTLRMPETNPVFIDRFLVSAEAYDIPVILIFNKIDLHTGQDNEKMLELQEIYQNAGYGCYKVSATEGTNIEPLREVLKDKTTVISGNSGVGKSTFINAIDPSLELRIGEISGYHKKGKHTTTFSEAFPLFFGGLIVDTPGIKGFGLVDLHDENLATYFPEMLKLQSQCRFYNCTHTHEPGCKVVEALKNGSISGSRYKSYISILTDDEGKYRDNLYE
ncbi:MAG: ribosome small subunit-dependent GTPase A [Bacteroidales bacterium]